MKWPRMALAFVLAATRMLLITSAIAMPIAYSGKRFAGFGQKLSVASGLLTVGFGAFISYQIAIVDGLLTAHPHRTPR